MTAEITHPFTERPTVPPFPRRVAWEITRRCDQPCTHCVNSSGKAIPGELLAVEAEDVCQQLIALGTREVALTGGEPYLRHDVLLRIDQLTRGGVSVSMQTGGRMFDARRAERFRTAGLKLLGVSIDGLEATHDRLRGWQGSFSSAMETIRAARTEGLRVSVNTQINALTLPELPVLVERLEAAGVAVWQPSLTIAAGRASAHPERILQPWQVVPVMDLLAELRGARLSAAQARPESPPMDIQINANLGYYGPHEAFLRSRKGQLRHWQGCPAGRNMLFIEADGTVTGSPFLPRQPYECGNVRHARLEQLWASPRMRWTGATTLEELWGFCRGCYYAELCRGGEQLTGVMTLGPRGNNPFCYHRVTSLARQGLRERLVPWEEAMTDPAVAAQQPRLTLVTRPSALLSPEEATPMPEESDGRGESWEPGRFVLVQEPIES